MESPRALCQSDPNPMISTTEHTRQVRDYFESHAEDWSRAYGSARSGNDHVLGERLRLALELTSELEPGARVLDAGCGAGPLTLRLAERGYRVVATDLSPQMIELCRAALTASEIDPSSVEVACGDILDTDYEPASFDAVYALGFLQYQQDELAALQRFGRLLKPGGSLVVSGPIRRRLGNFFGLWDHVTALRRIVSGQRRRSPSDELDRLLTISINAYSIGRLERLLSTAGFDPQASRPHGFVNFALVGKALGSRGELALHRFFTRLSKTVPVGRFANDLVALAKRPEE